MKTILTLLTFSLMAFAADIPKLIIDPNINDILFSYESNPNGVCRVLGFKKALAGTTLFETNYQFTIIVDEHAEVKDRESSEVWTKSIKKIICLNFMEKGVTGLKAEIIKNPTFKDTKIPFSAESHKDKICQQYGFEKNPYNSFVPKEVEGEPFLLIDKLGSITGGKIDGIVISSLLCIKQ